jgi:sialate O-acetylesterase
MKFCLTLVAALSCAASAFAEPSNRPLLAEIFTDHAVLQHGEPIRVWGEAGPLETITLNFDSAHVRVEAGADGRWTARLPAHAPGGPYTLNVEAGAGARQTVSDLMVGDVYLCSGQSNMEFVTRYAANAGAVVAASGTDAVRLFNVPRRIADTPQADFEAPPQWRLAAPDTVADFSALCWFFGAEMQVQADVPVGLIASSWGGTVIEAWMSNDALRAIPAMSGAIALRDLEAQDPEAARARAAAELAAWWAENDPGSKANPPWSALNLDETDWAPIIPEDFWETQRIPRLAQFDGVVWHRTSFTLSARQSRLGGRLALGPADDIDITYLNGALVGAVNGWDTPRLYNIAPGVLRAGRNVLAAGVLDTGGGGGFWGPAAEKTLTLSNGDIIPLDRPWLYRVSTGMTGLRRPTISPTGGPNAYTVLYNGMIAPLAPYNIKGVLWYQGESNANAADQYQTLLANWMADWRRAFEAPELAFFVVQLANFGQPAMGAPQDSSWAALREAQRRAVNADPRAALAVTHDIGDRYDIHPTQKRVVALRLADAARAMLLGQDIAASGPTPRAAQNVEGVITVYFDNGPLIAYGDRNPIGFELCDAARNCHFAAADMAENRVLLASREISPRDAAFVRFCWADAPVCNLYNGDDLPAVPFELAIE